MSRTLYATRDVHHNLLHTVPDDRRLVGMHGFAQTGKDTVAEILADHRFQRVAFADPMREAVLTLNPIIAVDSYGRTFRLAETVEDLGWDEAKKTLEVRRLLQVFGTEVGRRMFGEDFWVKMGMAQIKPGGRYVITDVRFLNEALAVKQVGGLLIKIRRPGVGPVNQHASDAGLDDFLFDHIIDNDGTIDDLRRKVLEVVQP